jgi:hypothetical protein
MVLNITEYTESGKPDTNVFIVYDNDTESLYLYGGRADVVRYEKTFDNVTDLYNFVSICVASNKLSISVNYLDGLTNYDDYDTFLKKVCRENEIIAYDNAGITKKRLEKYVNTFLI